MSDFQARSAPLFRSFIRFRSDADRGSIAAASDKAGRPARSDSYEYAFRKTGLAASLADWREARRRSLAMALTEPSRGPRDTYPFGL